MSKLIKFQYILLVSFLFSCQNDVPVTTSQSTATKSKPTYFRLLEAESTGIDFINQVEDQEDFNVLTYRNFYNGGGVAIGDINNDSLPDLYFTANLTGNKLYLNKGNFQFEDITEQAGVAGTKAWSTGVTMADVNGDGWLDIYVSNSGDIKGDNKENELFINNGDGSPNKVPTFGESAKKYGLNNKGYSTQAAFFDYDADGDLDCYLLNNSFKDPDKIELFRSMRDKPDELSGDKLYRNDGEGFTDVTQEVGIYSSQIGFGLGTCIGDVNGDMRPDIYVSNDFWERDYLYINKGDGAFSEELIDRINFVSISSMGGDIADINNDGHPEIISTDMLAGDNYRLKAMSAFDPYHLEDLKYRANYHYQIGQNCLHLNDGNGNFQEIAMLSGVAATDWSWGALFFDFENDGRKDLFVSNGIQRDLMYMDFRDFMADQGLYKKIALNQKVDYPALLSQMPANPIKNFAFTNKGNLKFENQVDQLGLGQASFSNGAAYGDLDNDGDMDLVINNVNMPAFIYKNEAEQTGNHFLKVKFKGYAQNPFGIGTRVTLKTTEGIQMLENLNTRGFQSSIEPYLIFGLPSNVAIDELEVVWPDRKVQHLTQVSTNQTITLDYNNASTPSQALNSSSSEPLFTDATSQLIKGDSKHNENRYNDFDHEILLLQMLSTEGPRIVKGDVNNDKREDFVVLGARDDEDKLFIQNVDGSFNRKAVTHFTGSKAFESTCGGFLDFDQDGDLDLLIGSGGNEYQVGNKYFILRYYINDGDGNFKVDNSNIPQALGNFSCLEVEDFDQDGDPDIFLGGRAIPGNYGLPPRSFLFINDNGKWRDGSTETLSGVGMVTDAVWADTDGDQDKDLVVVGEWMSVYVFKNEKGQLYLNKEITNSQGLWNRVVAADLDQDGDVDFVLGNRGTNTKLRATPQKPLTMFVNDFDGNGKSEFIVNWYPPLDNKAYPFATKGDLTQQLPNLRKQILKYEDYAKQSYESLFPAQVRQTAIPYKVSTLENAILWNDNNDFTLQALPIEAQVAPVYGIVVDDLNKDGQMDIWLGGNLYELKPQVGRHDASRGIFLKGLGGRHFQYLSPQESGIYVDGQVRDATIVNSGASKALLISRNNEEVKIFR